MSVQYHVVIMINHVSGVAVVALVHVSTGIVASRYKALPPRKFRYNRVSE